MRWLSNALSFVAALGIFGTLAYLFGHANSLVAAISVIACISIVTSAALSLSGLLRKTHIAVGAFPGLLVVSMSVVLIFMGRDILRTGLALATAVLFYILTQHLSEAIRSHEFRDAAVAISEWSAVLIIFATSAGLLAAVTFINLPLAAAVGIFSAISFFVSVTVARLVRTAPLVLSIGVSLLLIQGFVITAMLPISHLVSGAVLAVIAYVLFMLLHGAITSRVRKLIYTAWLMGAALLLTARWQ